MKHLPWIAGSATVLALCLAGCLKRKETITIARDGRVQIALDFEGDTNDVENGDAMPSAASGWQVKVTKEINQKSNGETSEDTTIEGGADFGPDDELPSTYADLASGDHCL